MFNIITNNYTSCTCLTNLEIIIKIIFFITISISCAYAAKIYGGRKKIDSDIITTLNNDAALIKIVIQNLSNQNLNKNPNEKEIKILESIKQNIEDILSKEDI